MPKRRVANVKKEEGVVKTTEKVGKPEDLGASKKSCAVSNIFKIARRKDGSHYVKGECFPSYVEDDILVILEECGLEYKQGFRHDELNMKNIMREDDVRKYICQHGLPHDVDELEDKEDAIKLRRWVAFSHVPIRASDSRKSLEKVSLVSDYQALEWLGKLGFQIDGETKKLHRGEEVYNSIEEIRTLVRRADNEELLTNTDLVSPRKRSRRATRKQDMPLKEQELVALRLWGAVSPTPLPLFGQEIEFGKEEALNEDDIEIEEDDESGEEAEEANDDGRGADEMETEETAEKAVADTTGGVAANVIDDDDTSAEEGAQEATDNTASNEPGDFREEHKTTPTTPPAAPAESSNSCIIL